MSADEEYWPRMLAGVLWRAAWQSNMPMADYERQRDVILALAHYANGTALSRDYRVLRGEQP